MNALSVVLSTIGPTQYWRPIADVPEDRMDGRDVLLWNCRATLCSWCDGWRDAVGRPVAGVTHWADVEGPRQ